MKRRDVFRKIKERFDSIDFDSHVHELKSQEASEINNAGLDAQLEYLEEVAGVDWLIEVFLQ